MANIDKPLKIGEKVIVTSTYQGQKGKTGMIIRTTSEQVEVTMSDKRERFRVYKHNAKCVK